MYKTYNERLDVVVNVPNWLLLMFPNTVNYNGSALLVR